MSEIDLDAIEARAEAATAGPWSQTHDRLSFYSTARTSSGHGIQGSVFEHGSKLREVSDAEFIAHARTDVPTLVARVRELEAAIERFREHCEYGERTLIANSKSTGDNDRLSRRFEAKASGLRLALSYLSDERAAIEGDRA